MGTTPNYAFPYPELTDPPDGPAQIKALATAIDSAMKTGVAGIQIGSFTGGPNNVGVWSSSVTFPRAFTGGIPNVHTNINSGAAPTMSSHSRASAGSATAFTYIIMAPAPSTFSVPLQWTAVLPGAQPAAVSARSEEGWHYVTATCHTSGCPKENEPVPGILVPDDPIMWGWSGITCGACGQPITDIVDQG